MDNRVGGKSKNLIYILVAVILILLGLIAYFLFFRPTGGNSNNNNNNATPTPTSTPTASPTSSPTITATESGTPTTTSTPTPTTSGGALPTGTLPESIQVRVPYSVGDDPTKTNETNSLDSFGYYAFRLFRTNRADTENFVVEKMIEGPSTADQTAYYWFTPIKLNGESNCGKDFQITKDTSTNTTTVQFCKNLELGGIGDSARVNAVVKAGVDQFLAETSPKKVIILNKDGDCVGDESGQNRCKN